MSDEIKGDFQVALHLMIHQLTMAENDLYMDFTPKQFASDVLALWDANRGNDWYSSTLKVDQSK